MNATLRRVRGVVNSEAYTAMIEKWERTIFKTISDYAGGQGGIKDVEIYELLNILEAMKRPEMVLKLWNDMPEQDGKFERIVLVMVSRVFSIALYDGGYSAEFRNWKREIIRKICIAWAAFQNRKNVYLSPSATRLWEKFQSHFWSKTWRFYRVRSKNKNSGFAKYAEFEQRVIEWIKSEEKIAEWKRAEDAKFEAKKWSKFVTEFRALLAKTARRDLKEAIRARVEYPIKSGFKVFDETARDICAAIIDEEKEKIRTEIQRLRAQIARLDEQREELNQSHVILNAALRMDKFARAKTRREEREKEQKTA